MPAPKNIPKKSAAKVPPIAAMLNEAAQRLERHDFGSALQLYQQALKAQPGNAAAAMGMAMAFNRTGRPADAFELLQRIWKAVSASNPKTGADQQAAVLAQMGLAQQQLGKLGEALETFRQASRLTKSDDLIRRIKQLEPLVSSPLPVQQLILQARQLHGQRQLDDAARTFRAALQLQSDSAEALHGLAMVLRDLKTPDEALPLLQRAVMLVPDRPEFFNDLGLLFQDRADYSKAVSFHKRAVKVDPGFVFAFINLGVAHKRLGQMAESVAAYQAALKINPRSPEAHNNLGNVLRTTGELKQAKIHLETALALRPGYVDAKANLERVVQALAEEKAVKPAAVPAAKVPTKKAPTKPAAKKVAAKAPAAKKVPAKKAAPAKAAAKRKK